MPLTGYRLYRGIGGLGNVDFATVLGTANAGATSITIVGAGHAVSTRYTYVLRPVIADLESPDYSCNVELVINAAGAWVGARPGPVEYLEARVLSAGQVQLRWRYVTPYGKTAPATFRIYYANDPTLEAVGSPQATETYTRDKTYTKTISLVDGATYYFVITARTTGGVESEASPIIGPIIADSSGPATPTAYLSASF